MEYTAKVLCGILKYTASSSTGDQATAKNLYADAVSKTIMSCPEDFIADYLRHCKTIMAPTKYYIVN